MDPAGVACTNCGKNMTTDDLRRTSCVHCGQVLAHHARAAQQVAVINQMMADRNGNGIPDAFEGLAANATANAYGQMGQNLGIGAAGGMAVGQALGGPYGAPGAPGMPGSVYSAQQVHVGPGGVYASHVHVAQMNAMHQTNQAVRTAATSMVVVFVVIGVVAALLVVAGIAVALFLAP